MPSPEHPSSATPERATLIHRELLQLGVLVLVAVAAFFVTRAVATNNRDMHRRNAAEWYRRGHQHIEAGRIDDATDAFRRATVGHRANKVYVLALARSLALKGDHDSARAVLLTLRESAPEDPEINLELARLAGARQDVSEALRFYQNTLYAPWSPDQTGTRRAVRFELIRFLLTHDQLGRAQSELLAATTDLPDDLAHHLEVAQLFADAGDDRRALTHFEHALRLAPDDGKALAGAGQTAFRLAQYSLAQRYLRRAPANEEGVQDARAVVDVLLSRDPLAARIGSTERRRRLAANFSYAQQRLTTCLAQRTGGPSGGDEVTLQSELQSFEGQLKPRATLDQDAVESGVDLIDRVERYVVQRCGPPSALDRALLLIGRRPGAESR